MKLKIVTPERVVLEADVEAVYGKTVDGEVGILPRHIPLIAPLDIGVMNYVKEGKKQPLAVMGGMLKTDGKEVLVLSDAAELGDEVDTARAQQAKERAEARLRQVGEEVDTLRAQHSLSRALVRLGLGGRS